MKKLALRMDRLVVYFGEFIPTLQRMLLISFICSAATANGKEVESYFVPDDSLKASTLDTASNLQPGPSATPSPLSAMIRSAIVPGWGQLYNGHHFKAVVLSAVSAGFATASVTETRKLHRAADHDRQSIAGRRNTRVLLFFATVTFAALDAYVDAHLADFSTLGTMEEGTLSNLSLRWRFD